MNKLILYFAAVSSMLMSCSTEIFDETEEIESGTHFLKVSTVSPDDEVLYPVHVYAYDANKDEVSTLDINSASDDLSMELSTGTYTIAAVSGSTDFSKGYASEPLMLAKGNVMITTKDETVGLTMQYAVAKLSIALENVPENIKNVEVAVNSINTKISPLGECSNDKEVKLQCRQADEEGLWKTDTVYVLPSVGESLTVTINFVKTDGSFIPYTYTYNNSLLAGVPYYFKGSYNSGIVNAKVTLTLEGAKWNEAVNTDFAFGEGVGENDDNIPASSDILVIHVNKMPEPCSVWNEHLLILLDKETGEGLLYSKEEWSDVSSADEGASNVLQAVNIASFYKEDDVENWSIPTKEQADAIVTIAGNTPSSLCSLLGYKNIFPENRYLCDGAHSYFNLYSKKIDLTYKSDTYYLRLVKPVKFIKNN